MSEVVTMAIIHIHSITNVQLVRLFQAETLAPTYRSTWRRNPEDRIPSTDMRPLTTGLRSGKYMVRRIRR